MLHHITFFTLFMMTQSTDRDNGVFLLDEYTHREQSVDVARFSLAITPHSRHRLFVIGRIPIRVEHYQPICPNKVQATAASLTAQHEDELWALEKEMEVAKSQTLTLEVSM